jgi:predicted transcriptional regulator
MPDWKMTGYILTSKHRTNVIRCLKEPKTVMQVATELDVEIRVVYKAVNELLSAGAIMDFDKDKKRNKIFVATEKGIEAIDSIDARDI